MAQTISLVCDWCDLLGMPNVPAVRTRIIALDGPQRRIDVCGRCDVSLESFVELYSRGQDLPIEPAKQLRKPVARTRDRQLIGAADQPSLPEESAQSVPEQKEHKELFVICPLPHGQTGEPKRVRYEHRGNHADMVHHVKIWDVVWEDPDRILTEPCEAHKGCLANGVKFTTVRGRNAHVNSAPLERVDSDLEKAGSEG